MSSKLRRILPAGFLTLLAVGLTGAALAWACTPAADLTLTPAAGQPGSSVQVSGINYLPGAPVTIRWNSAAGPVLASATASQQGSFTTSITIPAGAPDTYTVVGVAGQFMGMGAYTIQGPSPSTPGTGAGAGSGTDRSSSGSSGTTSGGPASARSRGGSGGVVSGGDGGRVPGGGVAGADPGSSGRAPARSADDGFIASASGGSVFADSAARGARGSESAPSSRSGAADLWAGFDSSASRILGDSNASPATGGSMPALPAALLALGLAAAMAGLGVAGARRRARARSEASSD